MPSVSRIARETDLEHDAPDHFAAEAAVVRLQDFQEITGDKLHDDEEPIFLVEVFNEAHDVRVLELPQNLDLPLRGAANVVCVGIVVLDLKLLDSHISVLRFYLQLDRPRYS